MAEMSFDLVYVGAGNKNLVNACYATKYGGLSVGLFEERHEAGGGWSTEESPAPGFWANHCSHIHWSNYHALFFEDFPEVRQSVEYVETPLDLCVIFPDDTWLGVYVESFDPTGEKTAELWRRVSEKDAETWLWMCDKWQKYLKDAYNEALWSPPKSFGELDPLDMVVFNPDAGIDPAWLFMSPVALMRELFEHPKVRMVGLRGLQSGSIMPDEPGMAILFLFAIRATGTIIIRGGTHSMAHASSRFILQNGGKIFTNCGVDKILIENGRAKGVRLTDGTEVEAKMAVVSGASPHQLILELTGPEYWDPIIVKKARNLQQHLTAITWYTWALHERPKYKAEAWHPDLPKCGWVISPTVTMDEEAVMEEIHRRRMGLWPRKDRLNLCIADWSFHDPTFAPPGKAAVLTEQYVHPAWALTEAQWKEFEKEHADDVLRIWQQFAPNMTWDNVIGYVPITPYWIAKHSKNYAPAGNWHTIDLAPWQLGKCRPMPQLANVTKLPIENLYPCACAWGLQPGAHSHQGYWVYKVMADKWGLRKPWEEKGRVY